MLRTSIDRRKVGVSSPWCPHPEARAKRVHARLQHALWRPSNDAGHGAETAALRSSALGRRAPQGEGQQQSFPRRVSRPGFALRLVTAGHTWRSMLTAVSEDPTANRIEPLFRMDCRIKPGNDNQERRERSADRRIRSMWPSRPLLPLRCGGGFRREYSPRVQRDALAFRRSATALAAASERRHSAQAALHASGRTRALPAPPIALKPGTWRPGRNAGRDDARAARERIAKPPAGTALAPLSGSHLESALH